jgi:uncharacterized protein (DUF362 family)
MKMSLVSFVKIKNNNLDEAISESLNLIGFPLQKDIQNIVIKPNLCYYLDCTTGYTTDPNFVASVAAILRRNISKDVKIDVVEADASAMKCKYAFKMLGYEKMAQRHNLNLVNLSEDECRKANVTVNDHNFKFMMPSTIEKADLLINVTKMKYTMRSVKITCAMKNIFGCNPYPQKYRYHEILHEVIVALNKLMKFDLNLIDGNIVQGEGARRLGLVMASDDIVAMDAACAKIMGIPYRKIKYLRIAEKENVGTPNFIAKGTPIEYFAARFPRHSYFTIVKDQVFYYLAKFGLTSKLGID